MKIGDRVTRKVAEKSKYLQDSRKGTVKAIWEGDRCHVKWDEKALTGQQHSTISMKKLIVIKESEVENENGR